MIYIQPPKTDPLAIIKAELKREEAYEAFTGMVSFRGNLLRKLIKQIEDATGN